MSLKYTPKIEDPNYVRVFDTSMRDGGQSPSVGFDSIEDLVDYAREAIKFGMDSIEVGYPGNYGRDVARIQEVVRATSGLVGPTDRRPTMVAMAGMITPEGGTKHIDVATDSIYQAIAEGRGGITVLLSASEMLRKHSLNGISKEKFLEYCEQTVRYIVRKFYERGMAADIQWYVEQAFGVMYKDKDPKFLLEVNKRVIEACVDEAMKLKFDPDNLNLTASLPDTLGEAEFGEIGEGEERINQAQRLFGFVRSELNSLLDKHQVVLSAHMHNDLGFGLMNTLSAVDAGARAVEGTVLGIGERAGNVDLLQVLMAFVIDGRFSHIKTSVDTKQSYDLAMLISKITGQVIPTNYPLLGKQVFSSAAGVHQRAIINAISVWIDGGREGRLILPYSNEKFSPTDFGVPPEEIIVLGSQSGKAAVEFICNEANVYLPPKMLKKVTTNLNQKHGGPALGRENFVNRYLNLDLEIYEYFSLRDQLNDGLCLERLSYREKRNNYRVSLRLNHCKNIASDSEEVKGNVERFAELLKDVFLNYRRTTVYVEGGGPVNAAVEALRVDLQERRLIKTLTMGDDYMESVYEAGKGASAGVAVSFTLEINGQKVRGFGRDYDSVRASLRAGLNAYNTWRMLRDGRLEEADQKTLAALG